LECFFFFLEKKKKTVKFKTNFELHSWVGKNQVKMFKICSKYSHKCLEPS
jgi:hypothetical protein